MRTALLQLAAQFPPTTPDADPTAEKVADTAKVTGGADLFSLGELKITVIIFVFGLISLAVFYLLLRLEKATPYTLRIFVIIILVFGTLSWSFRVPTRRRRSRPSWASSARSPAICSGEPKGKAMRSETRLLTALTAALALAAGSAAFGQNLPRYVAPGKDDGSGITYFVKNVSGVALRCAYRINNGAWSKELNFPVNYEFGRWTLSPSEVLGFACRPPMAQGSNRLVPGKRYIVRNRNGQIQLVLSTL